MRRIRSGIVGVALAGILAGCGDSTVDEGPKEFRSTDVKPFEPMFKEMQDVMKKKSYTKLPVPPEKEKAKESTKKS
jgi:hypothetical protein